MTRTPTIGRRLTALAIALMWVICLGSGLRPAAAHEVLPTIADFTVRDGDLQLTMLIDIEAHIAGIDLSSAVPGRDGPETAAYEALRALPAAAVLDRFKDFWPTMAGQILVTADSVPLTPDLQSLTAPVEEQPGVSRTFTLKMSFDLPDDARSVTIGWQPAFGPLVLRQNGVDAPYDGYLDPGTLSPPIPLAGGGASGAWPTFQRYIPIGFDHIVPKGLDHVLFILGLFLLNSRLRPLLLQVSAFTVAHTVTLAAASANVITLPSAVIEPAIAASIVYIAVENILAKGVSRLRLPVVFAFGLLHGLGFASVLQDFGLPEGSFVAALLGFNIGVELGQLAVIALAFLLVGVWFNRHQLYRALVVIPGSALIGIVGAVWLVERVT